jgi:hypothetical protein
MLTLYFRCRHSSTKVYAGFLTPFWKRQNPHDQRILTKSSADIREHGKQPRQIAEMAASIGYPSGIGSDIQGRIQDMLKKNREAAAGLSPQPSATPA